MKPRVLIADDDPDLREIVKLTLERDGFEVIEAANAEQTLARALDSAPALILLDIMMPGADGFDTCRQLKSDQRTLAVPVIFISGQGDPRAHTRSLQLGAADCLDKPFHPRDLSQRVRMAIQRRGTNTVLGAAAQS
jgi:DNA-binding response OmpR family regulator